MSIHSLRKLFWIIPPLLLLLFFASTPESQKEVRHQKEARHLTILHICDFYEITAMKEGKEAGFARLKSYVDQVRQENPYTLLLSSGDFLSPSMMSGIFKGEQMIQSLNAVGLDYTVPGNHEFDFGMDVLQKRVMEAKFGWVVSNLTLAEKTLPQFRSHIIHSVADKKIGIFGLISPETKALVHGLDSLSITDFEKSARAQVKQLKERGADFIIALTHLDLKDEQRLAKKALGIDLILGGHDHVFYDNFKQRAVGESLLIESGVDLQKVGRLDIPLSFDLSQSQFSFISMDQNIPEDPQVAALVDGYRQKLDDALNQEIGQTQVALDTTRIGVRAQESNFGNYLTDALRRYTKADIALYNGGGIRSDRVYPVGVLNKKDIYTMLPFGNILVKIRVTGAQIRDALEHSVSAVEEVKGRFLQVSGLSFSYNPEKLVGKRILNIEVEGRALELDRDYTVATTDYIAGGGDGFQMFKTAPQLISAQYGALITDVLIQSIQKEHTIAPQKAKRIQVGRHLF
ncbi:bifunctional metallophosphatase/5'-nucleotidase [Magnetococcales bacterium HHB-1]